MGSSYLSARIANLFFRARLLRMVVSGNVYRARVDMGYGEEREVPVAFPSGLASHPSGQKNVFVLCPGGSRDNPTALVVDSPTGRPELAPGETALYNELGRFLRLGADGKAYLNCPLVVPDIEATGDVKAGGISLRNHVHTPGFYTTPSGPVTGVSGGPE